MKIAIFSHPDNTNISTLHEILTQKGVAYELNPTVLSAKEYDFVVSIGGDGTLLDAAHKIMENNCSEIPLLGINSGRLGFLTSANITSLKMAIENLISRKFILEKRDLLHINGKLFALNEFTAQRQTAEMIEIDIKIDGVEVANYWADGVIISTTTGSTAYSMSVGGAILAPSAQCFIVSPVAPHNLSIRPLVVPNTTKIELTAKGRNHIKPLITTDNKQYTENQNEVYVIEKASKNIELVTFSQNNFYATLKEKMLWGIDLRN